MLLIIIIIYFYFAVTVLIGGAVTKAIYKGYLSSKNRELNLIQDLDINNAILSIAGFPVIIVATIFVIITEIPFWFGKFLGKLLK